MTIAEIENIEPEDWKTIKDIAEGRRFVTVAPVFESLLTGVETVDVLRDGTATAWYVDGTKETAQLDENEPLIMCGLIESIQAARA